MIWRWNTICIEGFCFGKQDNNENFPCGQKAPNHFCLSNGHCPYFAYSDTTERDVAYFVPFKYLLWDKILELVEDLSWLCWGRLWFNKNDMVDYMVDGSDIAEEEINPSEEAMIQAFSSWLVKAKEEKNDNQI